MESGTIFYQTTFYLAEDPFLFFRQWIQGGV